MHGRTLHEHGQDTGKVREEFLNQLRRVAGTRKPGQREELGAAWETRNAERSTALAPFADRGRHPAGPGGAYGQGLTRSRTGDERFWTRTATGRSRFLSPLLDSEPLQPARAGGTACHDPGTASPARALPSRSILTPYSGKGLGVGHLADIEGRNFAAGRVVPDRSCRVSMRK